MCWLLNAFYLMSLLLALPWLLWRRIRQGKRTGGLWAKCLGLAPRFPDQAPRIWLHAVSVGEVLLLKPVIQSLQVRFPEFRCVLSVTTATGRQVAEKTYPELIVFWFPLDFTWAVRRALRRVQPRLILLAELELWPQFLLTAQKMDIPTVVVNGRLSAKSFAGYQRWAWLVRPMLLRVSAWLMQSAEYARRVVELGVDPTRVAITGSVKFDGLDGNRSLPKIGQLRMALGLAVNETSPAPLVWIVGSTQAPEELLALEIYKEAVQQFPGLRLILVPRHAERFSEVAQLLETSGMAFIRRSTMKSEAKADRSAGNVILADTLGELRSLWALADLAFVGGSFNDRGGQNMIEPAAYGVPVMFGPNVWNFQQVADDLLARQGAVQVHTPKEWREATLKLLADPVRRRQLGEAAREFVQSQQGATQRTVELVCPYLGFGESERKSAA